MRSYEQAVKSAGNQLKAVWGFLVERTWHWAAQLSDAVDKIMAAYDVTRRDVLRDIRKIIGRVSVDTLEGYCIVVGLVREMKLHRLITRPATGFTQTKAVCESSLPMEEKRAMLVEFYENDSAKDSTPVTVEEVKARVTEAEGGGTRPSRARVLRYNSYLVAGAALMAFTNRMKNSPAVEAVYKSKDFQAVLRVQETLLRGDTGPLFGSAPERVTT